MKSYSRILLASFILFPCLIYAQPETESEWHKLYEFSVGFNKPSILRDYYGEGDDIKAETGFTMGFGYTGRIANFPFRIGAGLDNFRCNVKERYSIGMPNQILNIDRNQTNLYFEFDPLVVRKFNFIQFTLGTIIGLNIHESGDSKMTSYWTTYFGGAHTTIDEKEYNTSTLFNLGLKSDLMFEIPITKKIRIAPRYAVTYYATPFFANTSDKIKGIKQNFDLVLKLIF